MEEKDPKRVRAGKKAAATRKRNAKKSAAKKTAKRGAKKSAAKKTAKRGAKKSARRGMSRRQNPLADAINDRMGGAGHGGSSGASSGPEDSGDRW